MCISMEYHVSLKKGEFNRLINNVYYNIVSFFSKWYLKSVRMLYNRGHLFPINVHLWKYDIWLTLRACFCHNKLIIVTVFFLKP